MLSEADRSGISHGGDSPLRRQAIQNRTALIGLTHLRYLENELPQTFGLEIDSKGCLIADPIIRASCASLSHCGLQDAMAGAIPAMNA